MLGGRIYAWQPQANSAFWAPAGTHLERVGLGEYESVFAQSKVVVLLIESDAGSMVWNMIFSFVA